MRHSLPVGLEAVRKAELDQIRIRRREAARTAGHKPPAEDASPQNDLVGMALSGGGLRSASFGLGVVQALHRCGLWRFVDYLSTVSGGSYLGGMLSTHVLHREQGYTRDDFPFQHTRGTKQTRLVQRFIYGGYFLFRPSRLVNRYLIGLLLVNLFVFSGMVALAALVSFLWRCLDNESLTDLVGMFDIRPSPPSGVFNTDLLRAFWPFFALATLWVLLWCVSLWRRGPVASGRASRWLLCLTIVSFLIGCALLVGNGDISGGVFQDHVKNQDGFKLPDAAWTPIVAVILAGLLPFLRPSRLLQSGTRPKNDLERYVFIVASVCLLVGVPLILVGLFARENLSGYNTDPYRPLVRGDWKRKPGWAAGATAVAAPGSPSQSGDAIANVISESSRQQLRDAALKVQETHKDFTISEAQFFNFRDIEDGSLRPTWDSWQADNHLRRAWDAFAFWCGLDADDRASRYWEARASLLQAMDDLCLTLNGVLADPSTRLVPGEVKQNPRLKELLDRDRVLPCPYWTAYERHEFNRLALESRYPELLNARTDVKRIITQAEDQWTRLRIFAVAAAIFLCVGLAVDLNAISMHQFYRNRIADAFLTRPPGKHHEGWRVGELETVKHGSPYHLIGGTVAFLRSALRWPSHLVEDDPARPAKGANGRPPREKLSQDPRWVSDFVFSQLYCGSQITGYMKTADHENAVVGDLSNVSVGDAIAISGAAVSPGHARNPLVAFLMLVCNFRLGQWVPNPLGPRPSIRPRLLPLMWWAWRRPAKRRPYCFVTDGGQSDNLGLVQLLRRKCRLILAIDAGRDGGHELGDLAKALRIARVHGGVRVIELAPDGLGHEQELCTKRLWLKRFRKASKKNDDDADDPREDAFCEGHFLLGRILYEDGREGLLVYVKPSLTGDEGIDILGYQQRHTEFPHESTGDQFFEEAQVESYRALGHHIGDQLCRRLPCDLWDDEHVRVEDLVASLEGRADDEPHFDAGRAKRDQAEAGPQPAAQDVEPIEAASNGNGERPIRPR